MLTEISLILAAVFWGLNFAATKYAAEFTTGYLMMRRIGKESDLKILAARPKTPCGPSRGTRR